MIRFNDNVSAKLQDILNIELHRYKREIPSITYEEWDMLVDWVKEGNSPYTNGDGVYGDDGWPLDFINTLRFWEDMREDFESDSESEPVDTNTEDPDFIENPDNEKPFG